MRSAGERIGERAAHPPAQPSDILTGRRTSRTRQRRELIKIKAPFAPVTEYRGPIFFLSVAWLNHSSDQQLKERNPGILACTDGHCCPQLTNGQWPAGHVPNRRRGSGPSFAAGTGTEQKRRGHPNPPRGRGPKRHPRMAMPRHLTR